VSVSSAVVEPVTQPQGRLDVDHITQTKATSSAPAAAVGLVDDGYEQPQVEHCNRESWATQFNDDDFHDA